MVQHGENMGYPQQIKNIHKNKILLSAYKKKKSKHSVMMKMDERFGQKIEMINLWSRTNYLHIAYIVRKLSIRQIECCWPVIIISKILLCFGGFKI